MYVKPRRVFSLAISELPNISESELLIHSKSLSPVSPLLIRVKEVPIYL